MSVASDLWTFIVVYFYIFISAERFLRIFRFLFFIPSFVVKLKSKTNWPVSVKKNLEFTLIAMSQQEEPPTQPKFTGRKFSTGPQAWNFVHYSQIQEQVTTVLGTFVHATFIRVKIVTKCEYFSWYSWDVLLLWLFSTKTHKVTRFKQIDRICP